MATESKNVKFRKQMEKLELSRRQPDKVTFVQGMDVTFVSSTNSDDEARELLRLFGMPFREA